MVEVSRKVRWRNRLVAAAVVSTLALGVAACGGSGSSDSSSTTVASTESGSGSGSGSASTNQNQNGQTQNTQGQGAQGQTSTTQAQNSPNQQPAFPQIAIVACAIGTGQSRLTVTASSTAPGGNKGVTSVHVLTYNDENASLKTDLAWLGPETGNGDQWSTARVAYGTGYQKKMTVVAKSSSGATKSADYSGPTSPCPN